MMRKGIPCGIALAVAGFLTLGMMSLPAVAMPSPKDIEAAVHSNDLPKAEALLREVLQTKASSAKAHYELGQVLALEGRHRDAIAELRTAQSIDSSLGFARSPQDFTERYQRELRLEANVGEAPHHVTSTSQPSPGGLVDTASTMHASSGENQSTSHIWQYGVGAILVVGLVGFVLIRRSTASEERAKSAKAKAQLAQLLPLSQILDDAKLEARDPQHAPEVRDQILSRVTDLSRQVLRAIETTKGGAPLLSGTLDTLQQDVDSVATWASKGISPMSMAKAQSDAVNVPGAAVSVGSWGHQGQPASMPSPSVVVHQDSGPGFLTGLVVGELMSGGHRDRIVERETIIERESPSHHRHESSDDNASERTSGGSFDSGSSSDWGSGGGDSSSFDSGSSGGDW